MKYFSCVLIVALALGGCAELKGIGDELFVSPKTPQQAVYQAEGDYLAAKTLAAKYKAQTPCATAGAPPAPLCSSPSVVSMIEKTEIVVEESLAAAERTVRDANFRWQKGSVLPDTVIGAQNAVTAFANIVNSTGVK